MDVKKYLEGKEFGGSAKAFPAGRTIINVETLDVTEKPFVDKTTGVEKIRFILKDASTGNEYWAGVQVMEGIQEALIRKPNAKQLEVIKTGIGMKTGYSVIEM